MRVKFENGKAIEISKVKYREIPQEELSNYEEHYDWKSFARVEQIARELTECTGQLHIPIDDGEYVSPRYSVSLAPKVGDEISYGFNGDYYPDGTIVSVSTSLRVIVSSTGNKYYRRQQSNTWKYNRTWSLVRGHVSEKNPHF